MTGECEYCGQEVRYGHNAICVMNVVEELRAEVARLQKLLAENGIDPSKEAARLKQAEIDMITGMLNRREPKP